MILLAVDTTLGACQACVWAEGRVLSLRSAPMARGHAEMLAPMVGEALAEAGVAAGALDRVAASVGPGSFTGLRVGLAFARAFALAIGRACVGVSTLEALALEAGEEGARGALIPAPGEMFAALYLDGRAALSPSRLSLEETAQLQAAYREAIWRGPTFGQAYCDIAALAVRGAMADPARHPPDPLYLRDAGASLPKALG